MSHCCFPDQVFPRGSGLSLLSVFPHRISMYNPQQLLGVSNSNVYLTSQVVVVIVQKKRNGILTVVKGLSSASCLPLFILETFLPLLFIIRRAPCPCFCHSTVPWNSSMPVKLTSHIPCFLFPVLTKAL